VHDVPGVEYVDLQAFDAIENDKLDDLETQVRARIVVPDRGSLRGVDAAPDRDDATRSAGPLESAFVCHLDPAAPDTLLLEVIR
jgi:hypothetical protein